MKTERGQRKFIFLPDKKPDGFEKIYSILEDIGVPRSHCGVYKAYRNEKLLFVHIMFGNRDNDPVNIRLVVNKDCSEAFLYSLFKRHVDNAARKYAKQSGISEAEQSGAYDHYPAGNPQPLAVASAM